MAEKLIKKLNNREFYAKYSDYAAMDEDGERLSDRKVKSVELDAASGTMTVTNTDGTQEIPVVPVPDQEGKVLKSNADGTYAWGAAGAEPGSGKLYVKFGSAPEVDTNFNANSDSNVTLVIPLASAVAGNKEDGLMSSDDKGVLDGLPDKIGRLDGRIDTIEHDYVTSQGLQTALSPIESDVASLGGQVGSLDQGKADKVSQATPGNLAALDAGGDLEDSGISGSSVSAALTKLGGIDSGAQVNVIEKISVDGTEITPENKAVNIDLSGKVDVEPGKELSSNDYTTPEKQKLAGIASGAEVNTVVTVKVNGSALTPDASRAVDIDISGKVDKVDGKQLSTEDYTTEEKTKLGQVAEGAQVNVIETVQLNGTKVTPTGKTVNIQLDKSSVGLGNVDNTSDPDKPISTATQSALDGKADKSAMSISDVSGDSTKKTIQLKEGLTQDVVVDVSGKQDSLPQSSANQYLITDSNNALAWGNIPTIEPAKVHILTKTADFTLSEFNEIWNWLENGHIVGVYRRMQIALTDMDCLYLARQRYTTSYGRTIAFVFDKINADWDNNENGALVAYLGMLLWNSNYSKNSISFIERTMIPDPVNNQNKFLFCNGSSGFSYVPAFRVTASNDSSFSAVSGTSNILNVNSSRGYLGAGTALHKYLMLDESNVTDASDDGKLVTLDYNNGNFKLGLSSVNSVPASTSADEGKLLSVNSQGNASWTSLAKSSWGTVIMAGDNALADENDNLIFDENETELWTSFNNVGFGAERAIADVEGNDIIDTYAKKSEVPDVSQFQQKLVPDTKTAAASVTVGNNKVTLIELASDHSISAMEISCSVAAGESANFAVEIDNKSASLDCVVTLVLTVGGVQQTIRLAASSGAVAKVKAGKYYQLTCVGSCWTLAEFA